MGCILGKWEEEEPKGKGETEIGEKYEDNRNAWEETEEEETEEKSIQDEGISGVDQWMGMKKEEERLGKKDNSKIVHLLHVYNPHLLSFLP